MASLATFFVVERSACQSGNASGLARGLRLESIVLIVTLSQNPICCGGAGFSGRTFQCYQRGSLGWRAAPL